MQGRGLGGLLGRGGLGSAEHYGGNQAYGGRGGGLGVLLNRAGWPGGYDRGRWGEMNGRTGSGERMQMQQGANFDGQGYTQGQTHADVYAGRGMSTQEGFGGGRGGGMGVGGGLGLGSGPLGLPIPTPQMAIKKFLKKVSLPITSDDKTTIHTDNAVKDVLYLMIVNMPSEAEMAAAVAATEGHRR